jgi:hypothetical protein
MHHMNKRLGQQWLAASLGLLCAVGAAQAQSKLDELQKRIDEQRAAKARAAEQAKQGAAAQARLAKVVVQADAPCELSINGKRVQTLGVGITEVRVEPGQSLVSCTSTEETEVRYDGELEARTGQNTVLRLNLAGDVAGVRRDRAAQAERRERERQQALARQERERQEALARQENEKKAREAEAARKVEEERAEALMNARFEVRPGGVLWDQQLSLFWTQSDNGSNVNWEQAKAYCSQLGAGWQLPSSAQLQSLFKAELKGVQCGSSRCKVSKHFSLSNYWFWSHELAKSGGLFSSSEAWSVTLDHGNRYSDRVVHSSHTRALCVRRP